MRASYIFNVVNSLAGYHVVVYELVYKDEFSNVGEERLDCRLCNECAFRVVHIPLEESLKRFFVRDGMWIFAGLLEPEI